MTCLMMVRLGVYALGAADARERLLVEAHLPGCLACRAELARLAPLPGLLARVPAGALPGLGSRGGTATRRDERRARLPTAWQLRRHLLHLACRHHQRRGG